MSQQNTFELPNMDQLVEVMSGVLSGNNEKIQDSTKFLKRYIKLKESVAPLTLLLSECNNQSLRHLAGVLMKRQMIRAFGLLSEGEQNELQNIILTRFFTEPINVIRKSIGSIIGSIAQQTLMEGKWNELYKTITEKTSKEESIANRLLGMQLLGLILDFAGDSMKPFYKDFYNFFKNSIADSDIQVKIETVKCLINLYDNIGSMEKDEIALYKDFVPPIIQIVNYCLQQGDFQTTYFCFDAFNYLADAKLTILDSHLTLIVEYLCSEHVLLNKKLRKSTLREVSMDILYTISMHHRSVYNKNKKLLERVLMVVCEVISEPYSKKHEEELNEEQEIQEVALWLCGMLIINLNQKKVYQELLKLVQAMIASNVVDQMNAAFLILSQCAEGCPDQVRKNLENPIMNIMIPMGLGNENFEVRGAALQSLSYFAEYLPEDAIIYHQTIMPALIQYFGDMNLKVAEKALYAIDLFCDNMEQELVPYLKDLIPMMIAIVHNEKTTMNMKRAAISVIGSALGSVAVQFAPHLKSSCELLHMVIDIKETPQNIAIKKEAIQTLGQVASAFLEAEYRDIIQEYVAPKVEQVMQLLFNTDDYELREGCFAYFYNLANAIKGDFQPLFDQLIEFTIKCAQSEEGIVKEQAAKEDDFGLGSDEDEDDEQGEDDRGGFGGPGIHLKYGFLSEKSAAIHAMGEFAMACPKKFEPYFEQAFAIVDITFNYFDPNVREQTIVCMRDLMLGIVATLNNYTVPKPPPRGLPCTIQYPEKIETFVNIEFMTKFHYYLKDESMPETVGVAIEALENLIKQLGSPFIERAADDIIVGCMDLLEGAAACCGVHSDDEADEEGDVADDTELSAYVFERICDLIPAMAQALKEGFALPFQRIFPSLMGYMSEEKDINLNIQTVGCFAGCFKNCPSLIQIAHTELLPVMLKYIERKDCELNRNIAFCLGLMVELAPQIMAPNLNYVLLGLKNIYEFAEMKETKDNAAASICRVVWTFPKQIPLDDIVANIIPQLPFTGDDQENGTALKLILFLIENSYPGIEAKINLVITLLIDGLSKVKQYKIKDNIKNAICSVLQGWITSQNEIKAIVESVVIKLGDKEQAAVIQLLS